MTATGFDRGHPVYYDEDIKQWKYKATNKVINENMNCKFCGKDPIQLELTTVADLSHTGKEFRRIWPIDACIADIVKALDTAGIKMRHSCCGHGRTFGDILLEDGRTIKIEK